MKTIPPRNREKARDLFTVFLIASFIPLVLLVLLFFIWSLLPLPIYGTTYYEWSGRASFYLVSLCVMVSPIFFAIGSLGLIGQKIIKKL